MQQQPVTHVAGGGGPRLGPGLDTGYSGSVVSSVVDSVMDTDGLVERLKDLMSIQFGELEVEDGSTLPHIF